MCVEPITITGKLTRDEYLELHHYQSQRAIRPAIRILFATVSLSVLILIAYSTTRVAWNGVTIMLALTFLYFPFGAYAYNRFVIRRHFRKHGHTFPESKVSFTTEGLDFSNPSSEIHLKWEVLHELVQTDRGLVFFISPGVAWFYLPNRVFEGNDYRERTVALAAAGGLAVVKLR